MKFVNAININRKSGIAQWRDLRCSFSSQGDSKALCFSPNLPFKGLASYVVARP
jgi:hypothetical protein